MKNETIKINGSEYAPRVIFDNGGSVTVQLPGFAHTYDDAEQAADDVADWIEDEDTSNWEGHEDEATECDPTGDEMRNGGYTIWAIGDDISEDDREWGGNTMDFFMVISPINAELDDDDKAEQAKNLLGQMRDEGNWPMSPMVRVNLETGKMGVESDLHQYGRREVSMGGADDFATWIDPDLNYSDSDLVEVYDMVFDSAIESIDN